jgi:hypothetical protein
MEAENMDVNDIELFSTTDIDAKNAVVSMLVRNRISYLERWEKISLFRRREYGGARELCVIYVNGNQYDKARRILESYNGEILKKRKKRRERQREQQAEFIEEEMEQEVPSQPMDLDEGDDEDIDSI